MRLGRPALLAAIVAGLLLLLVGGGALAGLIADLLWYRSLDFENVFWRRFRATIAVRGTVALFVALFVVYNTMSMSLAERRGELSLAMSMGATARQAGDASFKLMTSAVFFGGSPPPTARIFPGAYMTAEPKPRNPPIRLARTLHVPVPAVSR